MWRREASLVRWAAAAVLILLLSGLVLELADPSIRAWSSGRPFTMNVVADVLVLGLTILVLDAVRRHRNEVRWRRRMEGIAGPWIARATALVEAIAHFDNKESAPLLHAYYHQAGFAEDHAWLSGTEREDFTWVKPALKEWLVETRAMLPLLSESPSAMEAASVMSKDLEACLGSFAYFEAGVDEGFPSYFFADFAPLVKKHLEALVLSLDFELVTKSEASREQELSEVADDETLSGDSRRTTHPADFLDFSTADDEDDIPF